MAEPWLDARQAVAVLGVKRATLYTYASRGWVRTRRDPEHARRKWYHRGDLERLRSRSAAHSGAGPRAAHALAWGEPVLTTAVSAIDADGPYYRGVAATDLVDRPLHRVAERLWGVDAGPWPEPTVSPGDDLLALRRTVDALASDDADRAVWTGSTELDRARRLVVALGAGLPRDPLANAAQVLCVDHGLNASTFAARVVASTGADLYACVAAGLAALSGPRHGTASLAVAALLEGFTRVGRSALLDAFQQRGSLPGFGHPLYPQGDPRAECLLERVARTSPDPALADLVEAAGTLGLKPDLDLGLLAVCRASGWPVSLAPLLFASGRVVGWIAHVFEQRRSPALLRPRAEYAAFRSAL
jgi:citrate synthase